MQIYRHWTTSIIAEDPDSNLRHLSYSAISNLPIRPIKKILACLLVVQIPALCNWYLVFGIFNRTNTLLRIYRISWSRNRPQLLRLGAGLSLPTSISFMTLGLPWVMSPPLNQIPLPAVCYPSKLYITSSLGVPRICNWITSYPG
jgi:hypothetical protein